MLFQSLNTPSFHFLVWKIILIEIWYKIYIMDLGLWPSAFALVHPPTPTPQSSAPGRVGHATAHEVGHATSIPSTPLEHVKSQNKEHRKNLNFFSSLVNTTQEIFGEQPDH